MPASITKLTPLTTASHYTLGHSLDPAIGKAASNELDNHHLVNDYLGNVGDCRRVPNDAYEKVLDELWQFRAEAREKYIQDVFIIRGNMTRQEWDAAFGNTE